MNALLQYFLQKYDPSDFLLQQKVRVLLLVCLTTLVVCAGIALYLMVVPAAFNPLLLIPTGILLFFVCGLLGLIATGNFTIAAHVTLIGAGCTVWGLVFLDPSPGLLQRDSVVYTVALIVLLPLLVQRHGWSIVAYTLLHLSALFAFVFLVLPDSAVNEPDRIDFLIRTGGAIAAAGCGTTLIFVFSQRALRRKEEQLDRVALAENTLTERLQRVEQSHNFLSRIIDAMPSMIIGVDEKFRVTEWNRLAEITSEIRRQDAINKRLFEVCDVFSEIENDIFDSITQIEQKNRKKQPMFRRLMNVTIYPVNDSRITGAIIRLDDVTDHAKLEELVIQSEKMMSVGGIAAGMAHEINNPLAGILQSLQVILQRIDAANPKNIDAARAAETDILKIRAYLEKRDILKMMDAMSSAGRQAAVIVANMLSFARKSDRRRVFVDLRKILDEALLLATNDYDLGSNFDFRRIQVRKHYDEHLPMVQCEPAKVQQVVYNLLKNGAHAMKTMIGKVAPSTFDLTLQLKDEQVLMEITDNGPGMSEEVRRRVFEPFFTTKEPGAGTGLGLSVAYFIITDDHRGSMSVASTPGKGTTFTIGLPIEIPGS